MSKLLRQEGQNLLVTQGKLTINDVVSGPLQFNVQGDSYFNGDVGVGSSSPSLKLHVQAGSINTEIARFTGANPDRGLVISTDTSGTNNDAHIIYNADAVSGLHSWRNNGTEVMRLNGSGDIGLGTSSPGESLQIERSGTSAPGISLNQTGTSGRNYSIYNTSSGSSAGVGKFIVRDKTAGADRLAIDSSGNTGIGTTSPGNLLQVNKESSSTSISDIQSDAAIKISNYSSSSNNSFALLNFSISGSSGPTADVGIAGFREDTAGSSSMRFYTENSNSFSERMRVTHLGQLVIGATSSVANDANRALSVRRQSTSCILEIASATNSEAAVSFGDNDNGLRAGIFYNNSTEDLQFRGNSNSVRMVIDNGGNIGMGTDSPSSQLHLHTSSTSNTLQLTNSSTGTGAGDGMQIITSNSDMLLRNRENGIMSFYTNNTRNMTLDASGNLGIGFDVPSSKLDVAGSARLFPGSGDSQMALRSPSGESSYVGWAENGVADRGVLGFQNGSSDLVYRSGAFNMASGTEVLKVTSAGTLETAGELHGGGYDLRLGFADQVTRGNSGDSRALVKEVGSKLIVNYAGDFTGGVEVQSDLVVTGTINGAAAAAGDSCHRRTSSNPTATNNVYLTPSLATTVFSDNSEMTANSGVITVPTGVTRIRLVASFELDNSTATDVDANFVKNGSDLNNIYDVRINADQTLNDYFIMTSHVLEVTAGDQLTFKVRQVSGVSRTLFRTSMSMEVIK